MITRATRSLTFVRCFPFRRFGASYTQIATQIRIQKSAIKNREIRNKESRGATCPCHRVSASVSCVRDPNAITITGSQTLDLVGVDQARLDRAKLLVSYLRFS